MNPRWLSLPLYVVLPGIVLAQSPPADQNRWEADIVRFEAGDRQSPPPKGAVLFVGSSSIRMWTSLEKDFAGTPVINRGFGGSQIADSLRYAERIILPYEPRLVIVYAGDNDLANGREPEQLLKDCQALVGKIHEQRPKTRIAYLAIKPSPARRTLLEKARKANTLIQEYVSHDPRLAYIDVFSPMLNADGQPRPELFLSDGLHLNSQGYALWTSLVKPFLRQTPPAT